MKNLLSKFNRNLILTLTLMIIIFSTLVVMKLISENRDVNSNSYLENHSMGNISLSDIEDGKNIIVDYFDALKNSDTVILKDYLGYNMIQLREIGSCNVNGENSSLAFLYNDNFKPELISINTSLKNEFDEDYYINDIKATNNIDAYKVMPLNVDFEYVKEYNWDFILVKYSEQSPWKIHTWID